MAYSKARPTIRKPQFKHFSREVAAFWLLTSALGVCLCGCGSAASPRWAGGRPEEVYAPDTARQAPQPGDAGGPHGRPSGSPDNPVGGQGGDEAVVQVPALAYSARPGYRLGPGDELEFDFPFERDLSGSAIVRPDGKTTAPALGEIGAAGLTVAELDSLLHIAYLKFLRHPVLSVSVKKLAANTAYVFGEVNTPGAFEIQGHMSLVQLLARASGLKTSSSMKSIILLRRGADASVHARRVNVSRILEGRSDAPDVLLAPNDIVFVPRSFIAKLDLFVEQYLTQMLIPGFATYLRGWEIAQPDRFFSNPNVTRPTTSTGTGAEN